MHFISFASCQVELYCLQAPTNVMKSAPGTEFAMPAATESSESLELEKGSSLSMENKM